LLFNKEILREKKMDMFAYLKIKNEPPHLKRNRYLTCAVVAAIAIVALALPWPEARLALMPAVLLSFWPVFEMGRMYGAKEAYEHAKSLRSANNLPGLKF
jgi:hypothetical protein